MTRLGSMFALAFFAFSAVGGVQAGVIREAVNWDFDSPNAYNGASGYAANSLDPNVFNSGVMSKVRGGQSVTQGAGTDQDGLTALQFKAGNGNSKNVNRSYFVLSFTVAANVSSLSSITINYNYLASSETGNAVNTWTLGGAASASRSVSITQNGNWNSASVTFSGLQLGAGNAVTFTDTLSSYGKGSGNVAKFDNLTFDTVVTLGDIVVTPVPEPITCALALFGLVFAGRGAGRYYQARKRQSV